MLGAVLGTRNTVVNKTHWGPALKKLLNFGGSTWEKVLTSPETREEKRRVTLVTLPICSLHTTRKIFLNHKTENVIYSLALFHQWLLCALLRKIQVALAWPGSALRDLASCPSPTVSLTLCSRATPTFFSISNMSPLLLLPLGLGTCCSLDPEHVFSHLPLCPYPPLPPAHSAQLIPLPFRSAPKFTPQSFTSVCLFLQLS